MAADDSNILEDGLGDWRFRAVTRLAKDLPDRGPGRRAKSAGAFVGKIREAQTQTGDEFSFTDFSSIALALSIAISAEERAKKLRTLVEPAEYQTETGTYREVPHHNISAFFDFLEQTMVAMTFSSQALESFCNFTIQDKLGETDTYPVTRKVGGITQRLAWQAAELERKCSTSEKLSDIVPKLLSMGSPKGKAVWANFVALERVRDGIIHMKYADHQGTPTVPNAIDSNRLFFEMIRGDYSDLPRIAVEMLNYFTKHSGTPRWLRHPLTFYGIPITEPKPGITTLTIEPIP
jgi:hypothetical protein